MMHNCTLHMESTEGTEVDQAASMAKQKYLGPAHSCYPGQIEILGPRTQVDQAAIMPNRVLWPSILAVCQKSSRS